LGKRGRIGLPNPTITPRGKGLARWNQFSLTWLSHLAPQTTTDGGLGCSYKYPLKANLPVPVLAEPKEGVDGKGEADVFGPQTTTKRHGEARESTNQSTVRRRKPKAQLDSCGGQNLSSQSATCPQGLAARAKSGLKVKGSPPTGSTGFRLRVNAEAVE
jgi:hypothetical protein